MESSFYKYCPITDDKNLENEYSLINLLSNQVTFSRRKNFNDLFDSKVDFIKPAHKELKALIPQIKGKKRVIFKSVFLKNENEFINDFVEKLEKRFDEYLFYCVTDDPENNLMWSHYASSHRGFCIEWDSSIIKAEKVSYESDIASFKVIDLIKSHFNIISNDEPARNMWKALRIKLKEWEYESEYRLQLNDQKYYHVIERNSNFVLVGYEPEWIKSIIFGYRMSEESRQYVISKMPKGTKYKEIVVGKSSVRVVDIN
ncbi:putative uncharacterized protein (plasmid) [Aliivibrio wodanis]|uniref:DUF2971 domain-containing protein n=1 Tax=Aliivibrio wodanis TaxID=80852 RepID=A0A090K2N2_9GAMM|nr:putative uncharacterized protein [Aliivibrio wodanis]